MLVLLKGGYPKKFQTRLFIELYHFHVIFRVISCCIYGDMSK